MANKLIKSSGNVFEDLGFEKEEAANLKIRADLMISLRRFIKERGLTQRQAAKLFEVSQPRVSDLFNRKIEKFTIDSLVNMHVLAGMRVNLQIAPAPPSEVENEDIEFETA